MTCCNAWPADWPDTLEECFAAAVAGKSGLVVVPVAQRPFPIWLRAGTDDAKAAIASFHPQLNGLKFFHEPRRILEIGAGAGYRSVALAHAYPGAEILATEPNAAFQRVAMLNTVPYGNITALNVAVGTDKARYDFFGREGEAGHPALMRHEAGHIAATPLPHLLNHRRWGDVDTIVLTPDAASTGILDQPLPRRVRVLAVETGGAPLPPETMTKLPMAEFLAMISGDYVIFYRHALQKALPEPPRAIPIFAPDGPIRHLTLENVSSDPPGFFLVGRNGFRLHPSRYDAPPARVTISQHNHDYAELQVSMRVVQDRSAPVRFKVEMRGQSGTILASAIEVVKGGTARGVVLQLPEYQGPCSIVFTTQMAEPGASNDGAWAEFISATFV